MSVKKIWLIRHAESAEDVDPTLHPCPDDSLVTLTSKGKAQALGLGSKLSKEISTGVFLKAYLSTSRRAGDTWIEIQNSLSVPHEVSIDPRIRNLNWGNTTSENRSTIELERYKVGVLRFQFPGGDSTPDYVSSIDEFVRELVDEMNSRNFSQHIVIVLHGFAFRVVARSLIGISDDKFRWLANPPNAFVAELDFDTAKRRFEPTSPLPEVARVTELIKNTSP